MSTQFEFRVLAEEAYADVCDRLDRAAEDRFSFEGLRARVLAALRDPALQARNSHASFHRLWAEWLAAAPPTSDTVLELAPMAVAALSMPQFQLSHLAGPEPAPTLVALGDADGGLFGVMGDLLLWFEPWLVDGLRDRAERHGYGNAMFRMSADDQSRLLADLSGLDPAGGRARRPVHCREAQLQLIDLLRRVTQTPGWTIAVCETG